MEILFVYGIAFIVSLYFSILKRYSLIVPVFFLFLLVIALMFYLLSGNLNFSIWGIIWLPALLLIKEFQKHYMNKADKKLKVPLVK